MGKVGGARPGAGRPSKADELKVVTAAMNAIVKSYGSLEEGFMYLLQSKEPALIKFAWGHAVGNPKERVDVNMDSKVESVQIIELPDNHRDTPTEVITEAIDVTYVDVENTEDNG